MRPIKYLVWCFAFIGLVGLAGLSGCVKKDDANTIKISSWGDVQETGILMDLIADFEKSHPTIKVELQRIQFSEYVTKLLTQIAGGQAPDVVCAEVGNFVDLYLRGAFEPLNPYIESDHLDLSGYYPQVLDRFTVDNQIYIIPRDTAPICVVYYNKKAFDEKGVPYPTDDWTYDQFVAAAKKVMKTDAAGKVTRWGFVDDWAMSETWVYDFGGSYADNIKHPTRWTFAEDPHTLEGIQFRSDLINKYHVMTPPSSLAAMGGMGTSDMFMNQTVAMFLSGGWKVPRFREIKDFKWDVAMLPKGPRDNRAFSTGGSGYGILKSSTHKKEAWEFVKYISGEEGAKKLAYTGLLQPAVMKVSNSPIFLNGQDPQNLKMLLEAVKYGKYGAMCKNSSEVANGIIGPELDKVWNGSETAASAMKKLKPLLKENPPQTK